MEAFLYIDVLWLVQCILHMFLLWSAGRICGISAKKRRVLLGAGIGALGHCLVLVFFFEYRSQVWISMILLAIAVWCAYAPKRTQTMLRLYGSAVLATCVLGGVLEVVYLQMATFTAWGEIWLLSYRPMPLKTLVSGVVMGYGVLKWSDKWLEANIRNRREFCTLHVQFGMRWVEAKVLVDTGHGLKQEGRGIPILQLNVLLPLFEREQAMALMAGEMDGLQSVGYSSLGNEAGQLFGFVAPKCVICYGTKVCRHEGLFVGISKDVFHGAYEGLIPTGLIEEGIG